jgi:hypothetical protein
MGLNYNPSIVSEGLVFYLDAANRRCYSGSGLTAYGLVGGIGGTLVGAGFGATSNGYFTFRNLTDKIVIGNPTVLQGLQLNFTLSCWFNQISNLQYATLYADYSSVNTHKLVCLFRVDNGFLKYYTTTVSGDFQGITPAAITNGVWYFAAITVSGTLSSPTASVFLNGTTYNYSLSALSSTPDLTNIHCIGGNVYINEGFNGNISQVQIYNRALTPQEISQNFNATRYRYGI